MQNYHRILEHISFTFLLSKHHSSILQNLNKFGHAWTDTVGPQTERPQAERVSQLNNYELGPNRFEVNGF